MIAVAAMLVPNDYGNGKTCFFFLLMLVSGAVKMKSMPLLCLFRVATSMTLNMESTSLEIRGFLSRLYKRV